MQDGSERYVRDSQGQPLIWNDAGAWNYLLHDNHPGSTAAASDGAGAVSSRYTYDPFGVVKSVTGSQSELLFADGQYHAGLKLYRFGERWYNPALGRWTQQDPLHQPFNPREANRYAYVGADPVNLIDPMGTHILEDAKDFVEDKANDLSEATGISGNEFGGLLVDTGLGYVACRAAPAHPAVAVGCGLATVGTVAGGLKDAFDDNDDWWLKEQAQ